MSFILGIAGIAGSGKDTIGDYLVSHYNWNGKLAFARNLKDMCKATFALSEFEVSDHEGKKALFKNPVIVSQTHINSLLAWMCRTHETSGFSKEKRAELAQMLLNIRGKVLHTTREILQFVGTEFCREIIPTYHVDIISQKLNASPGNWIITDVRFPNEAEMLQSNFAKLVKVERPGLVISEEVRRHTSETSLPDWKWDAVIMNDVERVEDLYLKVDKFLEENNYVR